MNENTNQKNIRLLEIIIMVGVIGILSTLAAIGVNNAQKKTRDNRRIEDMVMVRSAMQLIYNQSGSFNGDTCAAETRVADCSGPELVKYINNIRELRDPDSNGVSCSQNFVKGCDYSFKSLTNESYSVYFYLEVGTQGLAKGPHLLTEQGIQ
ncbi:MAG: hypothetical protein ACOZBH_03935 [Patescibacteria group bacterium]